MKSKPEVFKEADVDHVLEKIKKRADNYPTYDDFLVDVTKKLDKTGKVYIDFNQLQDGIE